LGERLFAPLRLVDRPLGPCVRRPSTFPAPSLSTLRVSFLLSRTFARPGNGKIRGAIRYRQLQPLTIPVYRSSAGVFSTPRIRTPLGPFGSSWSFYRTVSTSDALFVTHGHARVGIRTARSARPRVTLPFGMMTRKRLTHESEDSVSPCR
jgi:hypothetical protein